MTETVTLDTQHEERVLGAMMMHPTAVDDVCEILTGTDFHDARLESVFDAIAAQHATDGPTDPVAVADRLTRTKDLARVGGSAALHGMVQKGMLADATWHAQRVRDASMLRKVASVGARMTQLASAPETDDVLGVVDAARADLDALTVLDETDVPNERAVYDAIEALEEPPGLPTPWHSLTKFLSGLKPGCVYVVGARPAMGKSLCAQAFVLDTARRHKTAIMFSLEMSKNELYHRLLASTGEIDMGHIQHRNLNRDDHDRLAKAAGDIARLGPSLVIDDRASLSVAQMRAKVRTIKRRREVGIVVVDYLQLVDPPANLSRQDRRVQVDAISRAFKMLAKDLQVPVVVLSQLNRGNEQRMDKKPVLSDLRESGAIEQDADVVIMLHRDPNDPSQGADLNMNVAKNRHGPTGSFDLAFQGRFSRVTDANPL